MAQLDFRQTLVESLPIAGILLFWLAVSWLVSHPPLGTGARVAGLVMALLYAVVRGTTTAAHLPSAPQLADSRVLLRVNGYALLAGGSWFVVAQLVFFVERLWRVLALPGVFTSPAGGLAFAFTATAS